jgi:hypothetical protein
MVTTTATVASTMQTVENHVKYNTTTYHNPSEADHCCGWSKGKPKNGYHHCNKYYLKHIVQVLLERENNRHLVFVIKDKPMLFPYSNRLVSQLWNTSNGISQKHNTKGELNFFDYSDRKRFYSKPDVVKYSKTLAAKGSINNLMCLSIADSES